PCRQPSANMSLVHVPPARELRRKGPGLRDTDEVSMTIIMREMLRCLDIRLEVFAFGKTHRPEEIAKLEAANIRLRELQAACPASWQRLRHRFLGNPLKR